MVSAYVMRCFAGSITSVIINIGFIVKKIVVCTLQPKFLFTWVTKFC